MIVTGIEANRLTAWRIKRACRRLAKGSDGRQRSRFLAEFAIGFVIGVGLVSGCASLGLWP